MSILDEFEKEFSEISIEQTMLHGFDSYADAISDVRHFLKDAYKKAVEDAHYESGHDPYNGTISTTNGVHLFPKDQHPRYGTKAFSEWEDKIIGHEIESPVEKRMKAGAVEIPRSYIKKHYSHLKGKRGKLFYLFGWAAE